MSACICTPPPAWLSAEDCIGATVGAHHVAVAIQIEREPVTQRSCYTVTARVVSPDTGADLPGRDAQPLRSAFTHTADQTAIDAVGELVLLRELARLVLGLPPGLDGDGEPLLPVSEHLRRDADIHTALAADARTGAVPPSLTALM